MKRIREWIDDLDLKLEDIFTIIVGVCIFVAMVLMLIGIRHRLSHGDEVSRTVTDARFTPSYVGIETTYEYTYDVFSDEGFKKVPNTHSKIYPDTYELEYRVEYEDGTVATEWETATKEQYYYYTENIHF